MQCVAGDIVAFPAVERISDYGTADRREMHPYLVCPSRDRVRRGYAFSVFFAYHAVFCHGRLCVMCVRGTNLALDYAVVAAVHICFNHAFTATVFSRTSRMVTS